MTARSTTSAGAALTRDRYVVGFAVVSVLFAWLPWSKSPGTSMFELTGGSTLGHAAVNAWDLPAKILWSTGHAFTPGGVELGWIVVGLPLLMVVGCVRGWTGGALRGLASAQAGVAVLWMAQAYRVVHEANRGVGVTLHYGTTDVLGLGPYLLLLTSLALLVAPRR